MAKKEKTRRGNKQGFTLPLAVVAGFAPAAIKIWEAKGGGASTMAREAGKVLTGWDFWNKSWSFSDFKTGMIPILGGIFIHRYIGNKLGINRVLQNAGIPIIRL